MAWGPKGHFKQKGNSAEQNWKQDSTAGAAAAGGLDKEDAGF